MVGWWHDGWSGDGWERRDCIIGFNILPIRGNGQTHIEVGDGMLLQCAESE